MTRRGFLTGLGALVAFPVVAPALKALSTALPAPFPVVPTPVQISATGIRVSEEMLQDSMLDILELMRADMLKRLDKEIDYAILYGA